MILRSRDVIGHRLLKNLRKNGVVQDGRFHIQHKHDLTIGAGNNSDARGDYAQALGPCTLLRDLGQHL
jgi:hypothetical protein